MRVNWEVNDGYCGKGRPQFVEIDDSEFDDCETDAERQKIIEEYVQDDFNSTISWEIIDIEE